jgi:hypothetical protein
VTAAIPEGKDEAEIPVSAADGAQAKTWKVAVIGSADVKGPLWVCSEPADLTVAAPFLVMKFDPANVEKGKETDLVAKLEQKTPFEGKAKAHLGGLPANVTADDIEIAPTDEKVTFKLKTTDKAPPGQHKSLICQVTVTKDGEPIVHNLGRGGVLRIDAPLSEQKKDPKKDAKKPQSTASAQKEAGK